MRAQTSGVTTGMGPLRHKFLRRREEGSPARPHNISEEDARILRTAGNTGNRVVLQCGRVNGERSGQLFAKHHRQRLIASDRRLIALADQADSRRRDEERLARLTPTKLQSDRAPE